MGSATAHVKWLSIMVPIYLYSVAQLSCKGRSSCNYILGQTLRRHKPAQPISQLLLSHSISLDTLRTRHYERVPTQHPLPRGVREPNSVGLPVSLTPAHQDLIAEPVGSGIPGKRGHNNIPCHANVVLHTLKSYQSALCTRHSASAAPCSDGGQILITALVSFSIYKKRR